MLLIAYKDNQMMYNTQSNANWDAMQMQLMPVPAGCSASTVPVTRSAAGVPEAIALFGQYKALVKLWNYLALARNNSTKINANSEVTEGVTVQAQATISMCDVAEPTAVSASIKITLVSGQTGPYTRFCVPAASASLQVKGTSTTTIVDAAH